MNSVRSLLLALAVYGFCATAYAETFAIQNANIVDVERGEIVPARTIVATNGRITSVDPNDEVTIPPDAVQIDATGKFATPGLWDMHVHLARAGEFFLPVLVANGVTHVRDMGGPYEEVFRLRDEVAAGNRIGPHILAAGPIFESARWVKRARAFLTEEELAARIPLASAEECSAAVDRVLSQGADFLKFRTIQSRDLYMALADAAKSRGVALVGHAPPPAISLLDAATAGQRSIEHYIRIVGVKPLPDDTDAAFALFREAGTHFVPTLVSGKGFRVTPDEYVERVIADESGTFDPRRRYVPASMIAKWKQQLAMKQNERMKLDYEKIHADNVDLFAQMHLAGVPIMAGTDLTGPMVFPGFSLHTELTMFVDELGMTPAEALRSATAVPAKFVGMDESYGTIGPGKAADLVMLDANPLDDIRNTQQIWAVLSGDRYLSRDTLDRFLEDAADSAQEY